MILRICRHSSQFRWEIMREDTVVDSGYETLLFEAARIGAIRYEAAIADGPCLYYTYVNGSEYTYTAASPASFVCIFQSCPSEAHRVFSATFMPLRLEHRSPSGIWTPGSPHTDLVTAIGEAQAVQDVAQATKDSNGWHVRIVNRGGNIVLDSAQLDARRR